MTGGPLGSKPNPIGSKVVIKPPANSLYKVKSNASSLSRSKEPTSSQSRPKIINTASTRLIGAANVKPSHKRTKTNPVAVSSGSYLSPNKKNNTMHIVEGREAVPKQKHNFLATAYSSNPYISETKKTKIGPRIENAEGDKEGALGSDNGIAEQG